MGLSLGDMQIEFVCERTSTCWVSLECTYEIVSTHSHNFIYQQPFSLIFFLLFLHIRSKSMFTFCFRFVFLSFFLLLLLFFQFSIKCHESVSRYVLVHYRNEFLILYFRHRRKNPLIIESLTFRLEIHVVLHINLMCEFSQMSTSRWSMQNVQKMTNGQCSGLWLTTRGILSFCHIFRWIYCIARTCLAHVCLCRLPETIATAQMISVCISVSVETKTWKHHH